MPYDARRGQRARTQPSSPPDKGGTADSLDIDVEVQTPVSGGHLPTEDGRRPITGPGQRSGRRDRRSKPSPSAENTDNYVGRVLGSYRIKSLIGSGGMGRVYYAEHVLLGRKVALKLLRPEYAVKRDAVHRFFQEARAVNQIGHDNIVDVTDFVELDSGETFFIMELLRGRDLGQLLRESRRPLPLHRAMNIAVQVCDGLEAAHNKGIIHRDLKPDNIFIVNQGKKTDFVKLLDFGVAKLQGASASASWQTAAGSVIGTPAYMSPEQASGIGVDNRSDIYSLGAILYELFTGQPVFRAKSFGEYVVKHMKDLPVPPHELPGAPQIPVGLERVILRCLEKEPANRYPSAAELREDLTRVNATAQVVTRVVSQRRSRRRLYVFIAVAAMVLLAAGAFWIAAGLGEEDLVDVGEGRPLGQTGVDKAPGVEPVAAEPVAAEPNETAPVAAEPGETTPAAPAPAPTEQKPSTASASIQLETDPPGAAVFRAGDTVPLGRTPYRLDDQPLGDRVELVFRLKGYKDAHETVRAGEDHMVSVALSRKPNGGKRAGRRGQARPRRPQGTPGAPPARGIAPGTPDQPATPETKTPETKTPETKTPETKTPETKTPKTKTPKTKTPKTKTPKTISPEAVVDPFAS